MGQVSLSKTKTARQNYQGIKVQQDRFDGNAVRKLEPQERYKQKNNAGTKKKVKNETKVSFVSFMYLFLMISFIAIVCVTLLFYVNLQSDITNRVNHISKMESELNDLRLSNDENYTKIMSQIDLEEIKRIAINELGMKYAKEGQVITYTGEGSDYVRQFSEIPD